MKTQTIKFVNSKFVRTATGGGGLEADADPVDSRHGVYGTGLVGNHTIYWRYRDDLGKPTDPNVAATTDPVPPGFHSADAWSADSCFACAGSAAAPRTFVMWEGPADAPSIDVTPWVFDNVDHELSWKVGEVVTVPPNTPVELPRDLSRIAESSGGHVSVQPPKIDRFVACMRVEAAEAAPDGTYEFTIYQTNELISDA